MNQYLNERTKKKHEKRTTDLQTENRFGEIPNAQKEC